MALTALTRVQQASILALVEAGLAAYGYRTTNGPGQHEALGRYLRVVFDKPPAEKAAREFDRLRRARNQDRYEARPVGAGRPRRPSRSPGRCSPPPSPEGCRGDPAVRKQSARSPAETDDGQRRLTIPRMRVCPAQTMLFSRDQRWPTTTGNPRSRSVSMSCVDGIHQ